MSGAPVAIEVRDLQKSFQVPDPEPRGLKSRLLHPVERHMPHQLDVLKGITFDVHKGQFFGVVGRNGSGKSTLLRVLSSIYQVDRGSVRVAGRIGPLIELGVGFDPELSARENVVLNGVMLGLTPKELRKNADAALEFAEVEEFGDVALKNFSSGMRVRLAFASLVQTDPEILLVDEILAVGDAGFREKCTQTFLDLKKRGRTIVFVTHNMSDVKTYCDEALLLEAGQIEEQGEADAVVKRYFEVTLQHRPDGRNDKLGGEDRRSEPPEMRARITTLSINGSADGAGNVLDERAEIELAAEILIERPMRVAGLRIEIRSAHGARVFAPPDPSIAVGGEFEPGQVARADATIENPLAPGRYTVACALLREEGESKVAASPVRTLEFEVAGESRPGTGLVDLGHKVRIEAGSPPGGSER